jgi:hypothetical protein
MMVFEAGGLARGGRFVVTVLASIGQRAHLASGGTSLWRTA